MATMQMHRRSIGRALLCAAMLFSALILQPISLICHASENQSNGGGVDYTASATLTEQFDAIFAGQIRLYLDRDRTPIPTSLALTSTLDNNTMYYAGTETSLISGYQCYIYSQAVYATLFNEFPYHGAVESVYTNSTQVMGYAPAAEYALFAESRVMPGAYLRTTGNPDGSYNGSNGHSLLILGYDKEMVSLLEGNSDGRGLITRLTLTWDDFNQRFLAGKSRYISHVVQPLDTYYQTHFGISYEMLTAESEVYSLRRCGQSLQLPVPQENLRWSSSDPTIATVDETGMVTALTDGTVIITAEHDTAQYQFTLELSLVPWEQLGELNGDGIITIDDAMCALQYYAATLTGKDDVLTDDILRLADIDNNDTLTANDCMLILRYYLNDLIGSNSEDAAANWSAAFARLLGE